VGSPTPRIAVRVAVGIFLFFVFFCFSFLLNVVIFLQPTRTNLHAVASSNTAEDYLALHAEKVPAEHVFSYEMRLVYKVKGAALPWPWRELPALQPYVVDWELGFLFTQAIIHEPATTTPFPVSQHLVYSIMNITFQYV
jgi:hypothetical protein